MTDIHMLLRSHLKTLRLPAVARHYEETARDAVGNNSRYEDYLLALLDLEIKQRETRRRSMLVKRARFPMIKTLSHYNFSVIPGVNQKQILQLAGCEYIKRCENIIFLGDGGVGKTHLAISLGILACENDYQVGFFTVHGLANLLMEARSELSLNRLLKRLNKLDLLICDELGYLTIGKDGADLLFQALSDRYERKSTMITTNLAFSDWGTQFPSERTAGALIDRLTHHCHIIEMHGDSYRFKEGLKNRNKEKK